MYAVLRTTCLAGAFTVAALPGGVSLPEARLGTPLLSCVNLWSGIFLPSYQWYHRLTI